MDVIEPVMEDACIERLREFFSEHPKTALAFSGGADSAFLLHCAKKFGCDVRAYYVSTEFQPQFEKDNAVLICGLEDADLTILEDSALSDIDIISNGPDRCYHCKRAILSKIAEASKIDGYGIIIDGTNASDPEDDRPGMKALKVFGIFSPLRSSGISKSEVREYSKKEGLLTWDLPSYSCLATRVQAGRPITGEDLERIERAETYLRFIGFTDLRVRSVGGNRALVQVTREEYASAEENWESIETTLSDDFDKVTLDPEPRR